MSELELWTDTVTVRAPRRAAPSVLGRLAPDARGLGRHAGVVTRPEGGDTVLLDMQRRWSTLVKKDTNIALCSTDFLKYTTLHGRPMSKWLKLGR